MKYNKEMVEKIVKLLEAGNYNETACEYVGISEDTFYRWIKEKSEFSESVKKAKAKAVARNVMIIEKAAQKTWQAAAWWLERTNYKRWGRKERISVDTPDGVEIIFKNGKKKS